MFRCLKQNAAVLTTTTAFLIIYLSFFSDKKSEGKYSEAIYSCLPNHSFYLGAMKSGLANRTLKRTPLKIIAAYDYSQYSVVTTESVGWFGRPVFCRYLDENRRELTSIVFSNMFLDSVVYCCSRKEAHYMAVTQHEGDPIDQAALVKNRRKDAPKYFLSLCLAPIYGSSSKWLMLAELFEHYKLQGVEHFYVYIKEVDSYSRKVIDYYVWGGEVEVVHLERKHLYDVVATQIIGVMECLQRSRHHSRYAFFADLDERVLPRHGYTLSTFAEQLRETMANVSNRAMIRFTSRWVFRTSPPPSIYEGEKTLKKHLPMMVFHNSSAVPPRRIIQKCILDPRHVLIHFVHQVRAYYPGYEGYDVPFEDMHIRHYREIASGNWSNEWMERIKHYGRFEFTSYPDEHMRELCSNVRHRLYRIYNK